MQGTGRTRGSIFWMVCRVHVDWNFAYTEISLSDKCTEASRTVETMTSTPCVDLVSKSSMFLWRNQLAPIPPRAMRFPVTGILWPHHAAFHAHLKSIRYAVTEALIESQQHFTQWNGVSCCVCGEAHPSEVFAGEKQANAV